MTTTTAQTTQKTTSSAAPTTPTTAPTVPVIEDGKHITFRDTSASGGSIGVWWWKNTDAKNTATRDRYLKFLQENQVSEIYLSAGNMSNAQTAEFIRAAAARGMRVALLSGDASWIQSGNTDVVRKYLAYQSQAPADARYYALHLDVEPHQLGEFSSNRQGVMQQYADYVGKVAAQLHAAGEAIEWDIPFWLESDTVTVGGQRTSLLEYIAEVSDTITVMSYRDSSDQILGISREEIAAARKKGCKVILGVETSSKEGDFVSFMEEGKAVMYRELGKVYRSLKGENLPAYGVAIHHMSVWYNLKD